MKPLNFKERRSAIFKFFMAFVPVVLMSLIGTVLFSKTAREHTRYIKKQYKIDKDKYAEQASVGEKVDTVLTLCNKLMIEEMNEDQYRRTQKLISKTIDNALNYDLTREKGSPYNYILKEAKEVQTVLDTTRLVEQEYDKTFKQLRICEDLYAEANNKNKGKKKKNGTKN